MTDATKSLISKISDRYKGRTDEKNKARDSLGFNRYNVNYLLLCLFSLCVWLCLWSTLLSTVISHPAFVWIVCWLLINSSLLKIRRLIVK